jgi:hypothetical protein
LRSTGAAHNLVLISRLIVVGAHTPSAPRDEMNKLDSRALGFLKTLNFVCDPIVSCEKLFFMVGTFYDDFASRVLKMKLKTNVLRVYLDSLQF